MAVFQQIATEARQSVLEHSGTPVNVPHGVPRRAGAPIQGRPDPNPSTQRGEATWDPESIREQDSEQEREREFQSQIGKMAADGKFAGEASPGPRTGVRGEASGSWDRIRSQSFPKQAQSGSSDENSIFGRPDLDLDSGSRALKELGVPIDDKERSEEQRAFDELLEKERRGVGSNEAWR
jgi:hypothetical protein